MLVDEVIRTVLRDRTLLSVEDMREVRARLGKLRVWNVQRAPATRISDAICAGTGLEGAMLSGAGRHNQPC